MSKKRKTSQFPKGQKESSRNVGNSSKESQVLLSGQNMVEPTVFMTQRVQPEQMSLLAHEAIQSYLTSTNKSYLSQEDLNAVLRLSQHLRIFGLLSAVGYINQSNDQQGKIRLRTVPVWHGLLGQLIAPIEDLDHEKLMEKVIKLTKEKPQEYMALWRKSLLLTHHWNFWARAYSQD